jgi:tripartite-type tricarboxylate transporter receptor subunit TctC
MPNEKADGALLDHGFSAVSFVFAQPTAEVFPSRDINNVFGMGAGGGTALANRIGDGRDG